MAREIVITDQHVYLNEHDISAFVAEKEVVGKERVKITLIGKVSDLREKTNKKPKKK